MLACAAAAAEQIKIGPVLIGLTRTPFFSAGSVGSEFVIVSLGQTCMIDRCFDSRMQLNVQLISKGPSRNSTSEYFEQIDSAFGGGGCVAACCVPGPAPPPPPIAMLREVEEMAERVRRDGFCLLEGVIPPEAVVS